MTKSLLSALVLTLFPEMFPGPLTHSLAGKALQNGMWELETLQIRDFAKDKHKTVDDTPYGGGAGMVMRADVIDGAIVAAKEKRPEAQLVYFTPRGKVFSQKIAHDLCAKKDLILLCGRYEGVDERVLEAHQPLELSVGDYVLSGGEIAAFVLLDACVRLLPGVMGTGDSLSEESFSLATDFAGLLEYPHYTRPPIWNGRSVPDVLLSGNHQDIRDWRLSEAMATTRARRPDLVKTDKK